MEYYVVKLWYYGSRCILGRFGEEKAAQQYLEYLKSLPKSPLSIYYDIMSAEAYKEMINEYLDTDPFSVCIMFPSMDKKKSTLLAEAD